MSAVRYRHRGRRRQGRTDRAARLLDTQTRVAWTHAPPSADFDPSERQRHRWRRCRRQRRSRRIPAKRFGRAPARGVLNGAPWWGVAAVVAAIAIGMFLPHQPRWVRRHRRSARAEGVQEGSAVHDDLTLTAPIQNRAGADTHHTRCTSQSP